jgi:peptide/nickel transport system substrate-binding protein
MENIDMNISESPRHIIGFPTTTSRSNGRMRRFWPVQLYLALICVIALPSVVDAQELRVGVQVHRKTLGVNDETSNASAQFFYNTFDTLIERKVDELLSPSSFIPGLATSWKMIEPTVMELKLRPNVKMHDGTIMDAEDVAFSLNRIFKKEDPKFNMAYGRFFYNFKEVEVVDKLTVRIHTQRPDPLIETLLSARNGGITSKEYVEKVGYEQSQRHPVGSGPYKVVSFKPDRELVVERFDDFWGPKPPLERIVYTKIEELTSRITALVNGEVDFINQIPPQQEEMLKGREGVKSVGRAVPVFHVWILNKTDPIQGKPNPLKNKLIRQALNLSVDREALAKGLWKGLAIPATAHQFPEYGELYEPDLKYIKYDPEQAKKLVAEANYDGTPIVFRVNDYYTLAPLALQAMKQMWEAVGLNIEIIQASWDSFGPFKEWGENIMAMPWSNPMYYPHPMGGFDTSWSESSWVSELGIWDPENPKWAETYETARFSTDAEARKTAYRELLLMSQDEAAFMLLYQPYEAYGMRDDIEWKEPLGVRPYTLTFRAGQIKVGAKK